MPFTRESALRWFCGDGAKVVDPEVTFVTSTGQPPARSLPSSTDSAWIWWPVIDDAPMAPAMKIVRAWASMTGVLMMPIGLMSPQPAPEEVGAEPMFLVQMAAPVVSSRATTLLLAAAA